MKFTPIDKNNIGEIADYYRQCRYKISDYSSGIKLMWRNYRYEYAIVSHCLIVKEESGGKIRFDYPVPLGKPDLDANKISGSSYDADEDAQERENIDAALAACGKYCSEKLIPFRLCNVPPCAVCEIISLYSNIEILVQRNSDDYLYLSSDFVDFEGKKYAGQRNHVRKFHSLYPTATFEIFTEKDRERVRSFWKNLGAGKTTEGAKTELKFAQAMTDFIGEQPFVSGGFTIEGEIISFCLSEVCGETLVDHIEKALPEYEGIYPATVQAFAKTFASAESGVKYINREDDAGSRGLRISKLQYRPTEILKKNEIHIKTALNRLKKIPVVKGENGISLTPITEKDIPAYNRLCLDDARNRWWGYDYREDCPRPARDYFYKDQKKDFANRMAMNFAIRRDGNFLGEVILYNFDFCGGAEIGVRILPEADGQKIGRYAFNLAANYAIYRLELTQINGKCLKENIASEKMLSSLMQKVGEDETYYYYCKIV